MHFYDDWAQRIMGGHAPSGAFYGLPGYPYLLAFIYKVFGYNPFVPGVFQAALDSGTAVLIYALSLRIFGGSRGTESQPESHYFPMLSAKAIGIAAAVGWALFVPAQAYAAVLMPTVWSVFIFWLLVWHISRKDAPAGSLQWLFVGFILGLAATGVATILVLVPLIFAVLLLKGALGSQRWRNVSLSIAAVFVGITIGTSPCWIHNYVIARDPVFLSGHSGINFWIGNNPQANGYPRFPPGLHSGQAAMLQDSITQAEAAAGHPLKKAEVSAYWSSKARQYIIHHFGEWLSLLGVKMRNLANAFQYDDLSIITSLRENNVIFPGLYFGIVAALALPGLVFAWRNSPNSRWAALAVIAAMAALLPVFVTERYRLVAVPGLLVFAVFGLFAFHQMAMTHRLAGVLIYLFFLAGSTMTVAWPQKDPSLWALDAYNSGWQALESNNLPVAEKKLAIAHAYVPDNAETLFALGNVRLAEGNSDEATRFYRDVIGIDPSHKGAFNNLGVVSLEATRYGEAETWFRRAVAIDPRNPKTHYLLAKALLGRNDRQAAKAEIEMALRLNPNQAEFQSLAQQISTSDP